MDKNEWTCKHTIEIAHGLVIRRSRICRGELELPNCVGKTELGAHFRRLSNFRVHSTQNSESYSWCPQKWKHQPTENSSTRKSTAVEEKTIVISLFMLNCCCFHLAHFISIFVRSQILSQK